MGPVHFKLSMSDGLTRRISFPTLPPWTELATRIHALCNIPFSRLAVSYADSDGDEVTLSSDEELRDFYNSNVDGAVQGNQLLRFHVVELGSHRESDNFMEASSPPPSSARNTFGRPTPFVFVDHDHIPFGDLYIPSPLDREMDSDSPHAFVEVVDDDVEKEKGSTAGTENTLSEDKGKARDLRPSVSDDVSSSDSVISNETPKKPPIHVQVHGLRPMNSGTFGPPPAASTPARETVTPTVSLPTPSRESYDGEAQRDLPGSFPDPPTPELDAPNDPNVSFSNDLASLLDSLNGMFLEHPEVGHHLRALFRNAGNGSYWTAQRDSMARVAEDIQRVARDAQSTAGIRAQEMAHNIRQQAQQEAARRVTEAVGNILRIFGATGADIPPFNPDPDYSTQVPPPAPPGAFPSMNQGDTSSLPRAPPAFVGGPFWNQFRPFPGPSSNPQGANTYSSAAYPPEVSYYTASTNRGALPDTSELKASLESAKASYKAEKEKYRREQQRRRRERQLAKESAANSPMSPRAQHMGGRPSNPLGPSDAETSRRPDPSVTVAGFRQIISNARGRFPQLEMNNSPQSPTKQREGDKTQHVDTVVERLEGMGFDEATYPTMRTVIESHLPADETTITKEVEDDVMSEVVDTLLETSGSSLHSAI